MIIKIFNQSKPINLVIGSFIIVFGFVLTYLCTETSWNLNTISSIIVAIFSLLAIDFICKKNNLSQQSSYPILFFALLINIYISSTTNFNFLFANFFILLALRKIISLKSNKNNIQKIFDAGFWIGVATFFSFWSILFYILLFISITLYASKNYKYYLVPLISILCLYIITNSYWLFTNHELFHYQDLHISFNYSSIITLKNGFIITLLALLIIGSFILLPTNTKQLTKKNKSSYLIISIALVIGIVIFLLNLNMGALLFLYFPIAVFISIIIENTNKKWIQYATIYILLLSVSLLYFV